MLHVNLYDLTKHATIHKISFPNRFVAHYSLLSDKIHFKCYVYNKNDTTYKLNLKLERIIESPF